MLSRIVLVAPSDPSLRAVHSAAKVEHGEVEIFDASFFGLRIERAYIITSKREQPKRRRNQHAAAGGHRR